MIVNFIIGYFSSMDKYKIYKTKAFSIIAILFLERHICHFGTPVECIKYHVDLQY
jgi:hypothetical protein